MRARGRDRAQRRLDPLTAARRRHLGELPRGSRRPLDHDRGLLGAAPGRRRPRRRAHADRRRVHPRAGRDRARPGVHAPVAGAVRPVVVGPRPRAAHRDRAAAGALPAQRLRLRLLGAPDDRRAVGRQSAPARPARCRSGSTSSNRCPARCARPMREPARRRALAAGRRARRLDRVLRALRTSPDRARCAGSRAPGPRAGSSGARRPTARGAGSSRPGSTR